MVYLLFYYFYRKMATKRAASDDISAHSSGDSKFVLTKYSDVLKRKKTKID